MFIVIAFFFSSLVCLSSGHGELKSPRSRNWIAHNDGTHSGIVEGTPKAEYCYHCLNTNPTSLGDKGVCGDSGNQDYNDPWLDSSGLRMPWTSQATNNKGTHVVLESFLDAHHAGHMLASLCPVPNDPNFVPTQGCFDANPLTFVEDLIYDMPKDNNNPERGYYAGGQGSPNHKEHKMVFKLPDNVVGNKVLLQWRYITANSCSPPGYAEYFQNHSLPSNWWSPSVPACTPPYPHNGARSSGWPEQFWNCAEITIVDPQGTNTPNPTNYPTPLPTEVPTPQPTQSTPGTSSPTQSSPGTSPPTTSSPTTSAPSAAAPTEPCCSQNFKECISWCGNTPESCAACRPSIGAVWLPNGAQSQCLPRWEDCTNDKDGCCNGLTCVQKTQWWWQCLP